MDKHVISVLISLLTFTTISAQDYYFVNAKNGLNMRNSGDLSAKKIAKIPYGVMVRKIEEMPNEINIIDNGKLITGRFVKIEYDSYPYSINKEFRGVGYVFDAFLTKKVHNTIVTVSKIDKSSYDELFKKVVVHNKKPKKISNLDSIKDILGNRVYWISKRYKDGYRRDDIIEQINTKNGQQLKLNTLDPDYYFDEATSGYFPQYDILLLAGGHSSDFSFSIATGETTLTAGNPEYIITSPQNTYRLNGHNGGQECETYFFQENKNGEFIYLTEFNNELDYCYFKNFHWLNENEFIFTENNHTDYERKNLSYYKGSIKK